MSTSAPGPPDRVQHDLDEALELLAALEDARDALSDSSHLAVLAELEHQIVVLSRKLRFGAGEEDSG